MAPEIRIPYVHYRTRVIKYRQFIEDCKKNNIVIDLECSHTSAPDYKCNCSICEAVRRDHGQQPPVASSPPCHVCKKACFTKQCPTCQGPYYCSIECQRIHYIGNKVPN